MAEKIVIRKGRERSIQRFHPWVFSGSVASKIEGIADGATVEVVDHRNRALGMAHFQQGSLMLKMLSFHKEDIDEAWFSRKLGQALEQRNLLGFPSEETNAYRLSHGEGDGLPGLVIDIYNQCAVVQPHSPGMEQALPMILEGLKKLDAGLTSVVHKPVGNRKTEVLWGDVSERIEVKENGMTFHVDVLAGQKTGFFLDQRNNREMLRHHSEGKRVLNVFSYTGGFSVAALEGGAAEVTSVDSSAAVLDLATENAALNAHSERHKTFKTDAVPFLESLSENYDIIVLDPPAFAKHKSARHRALQAYQRINEAAIRSLNPGGLLYTFSCSQVVDRMLFEDMLTAAAIRCGRSVQVIQRLRQPEDHPVSLFHPEGEYLKGLMLRVQ